MCLLAPTTLHEDSLLELFRPSSVEPRACLLATSAFRPYGQVIYDNGILKDWAISEELCIDGKRTPGGHTPPGEDVHCLHQRDC